MHTRLIATHFNLFLTMLQDYYAILETAPDADLAAIKSQYRKLVRQYHPDIAEDKESAHARMQLILEAYNVLSDVEKRASYDRARTAPPSPATRSANARATPTGGASRPAQRSAPRPGSRNTSSSRSYGGGNTQRGDWSNQAPASSATNPRTRLLTMVFEAANLYFEDGRAAEAIAICERVMKNDPSNAEAPALLGDIYADQGKTDLAVMMYERAMRRRPDNLSYRQKYESLRNPDAAPKAPGGKTKSGCGATVMFWFFITAATSFVIYNFARL